MSSGGIRGIGKTAASGRTRVEIRKPTIGVRPRDRGATRQRLTGGHVLALRELLGRKQAFVNKRIAVISPAVINRPARHRWPGNIRELENYIERAVILSQGTVLDAPLDELVQSDDELNAEPVKLKDAERAHIAKLLRECNGVIGSAAVKLAVPRSTLFYKMQRLGIGSAAKGDCSRE
jgi:DNA-binding NtrC family response regulator